MKKLLIFLGVVVVLALGVYWYIQYSASVAANNSQATDVQGVQNATSTEDVAQQDKTKTVLGTSVGGKDIVAYHYGSGEKELLFVGGIHGGYEWNTSLVAYDLMDYLQENPEKIPTSVRVTVIPVLNPDGLNAVVGTTAGRFTAADVSSSQAVQISGRVNGNDVDLNRNFDCDWQAEGTWQNTSVSGGSSAFSEPESKAIQAYVTNHTPAAVVVWYSAAGGVYSSACHSGILAETSTLTKTFAKASGYVSHETFDSYEITGDLTNWLAKINIPAISVLLTTHQDVEWDKNKAGIDAMLQHYAQ